MTFSDERVVEAVNRGFVAAWESVGPVTVATFDLGGGKRIRGALRGNVAAYVCDAEGRVLDALPGIHPPDAMLAWLEEVARAAPRGREEVNAYHAARLRPRIRLIPGDADSSASGWGSKVLKSAELADSNGEPLDWYEEVVTVVGGAAGYRRAVHRLLAEGPLRTPVELKRDVFERILGEPLDRPAEAAVGEDAPLSMAILEEGPPTGSSP